MNFELSLNVQLRSGGGPCARKRLKNTVAEDWTILEAGAKMSRALALSYNGESIS